MEYLIVFTVAAMMIGYVWILGRCLRNASPHKGLRTRGTRQSAPTLGAFMLARDLSADDGERLDSA